VSSSHACMCACMCCFWRVVFRLTCEGRRLELPDEEGHEARGRERGEACVGVRFDRLSLHLWLGRIGDRGRGRGRRGAGGGGSGSGGWYVLLHS
jgi:hypothetical protein